MNFFEMLVMSRKMSFQEGKVTLYGQDITIFPIQSIVQYIYEVAGNSLSAKDLYHTSKDAMLEYREYLRKAAAEKDLANWICETLNLYGQGKLTYQTPDMAPIGTLTLENSPFANELQEKTKLPVDNIFRGIIAGVTSSISGRDLDALEVECHATGSINCKIIVDTKEILSDKFALLCDQQI